MKLHQIIYAGILIAFMSCTGAKKLVSQGGVAEDIQIENKKEMAVQNIKWMVTSLNEVKIPEISIDDAPLYLTLNSENNRANGYAGCNTFMASYSMPSDGKISFAQIGATRMACPDPAQLETKYLKALESATSFTSINGEMTFFNENNEALVRFVKEEATKETITEKYWKLITLEGQKVSMGADQEREIFFILKNEDNKLTGFGGCNSFSGAYTLEVGNRIKFSAIATTMRACAALPVMEHEFLEVFSLADNYTMVGDTLSLNIGRRAPLAVFEAVYFN